MPASASPAFSTDSERPAIRAASHEHSWRIDTGDAGVSPTDVARHRLIATDLVSFFRQEPHALDETPRPGEHHVAVWRRLVKTKTARQPPVGAGDCYERERTDLPVRGIERRAVSVEGLAEA